jgi:hypothetical protein
MSNKFEAAKQIYKGGKYVFETVVPKIAKNLKERFDTKQKAFKSIDEKGKGLSLQKRSNIKKSFSEKASKIYDKASKTRKGKMGGGMMGRRMGYQDGSKKGKVPTTPKEKAFGMLSVNKGLDNNKNITFTDKIAGATGGKKKKKA